MIRQLEANPKAKEFMLREFPMLSSQLIRLARNVAQVQAMLGISRHLAYALIGDGDIPGMKIGNAYRVPKINVIRYALSAGNPQPAA